GTRVCGVSGGLTEVGLIGPAFCRGAQTTAQRRVVVRLRARPISAAILAPALILHRFSRPTASRKPIRSARLSDVARRIRLPPARAFATGPHERVVPADQSRQLRQRVILTGGGG